MRRFLLVLGILNALLFIGSSRPAAAQEGAQADVASLPALTLYTEYPSQVIGVGETVNLNLHLRTGSDAQVVDLAVQDLPEGWAATFRGGSRIVQSIYVDPQEESSVDLRLDLPDDVQPGEYSFTAVAQGDGAQSRLPITITVQEKLPPSLSLKVDLPTLRGKPDGTFRYNATLKNEGDQDLSVDLLAQAPQGFDVTFSSGGQDVTNIPLEANATKSLTIQAEPLIRVSAGTYPIAIRAQSGEAQADAMLAAEVVGQSSVSLTTPDGLLSGRAESGSETPFTLLVQNTGSAPAVGIDLSATQPAGWQVNFDPQQIEEIGPNQQVQVTANVVPADKALAGDYLLTFRAQPRDNPSASLDYRVTVRTSTIWGVAGIALIAVAVAVVGLAVMRFGRR
jgi:uncharacterized membrane protein